MIKGNNFKLKNKEEIAVADLFNDTMLCKTFGWTLEYVRSMNRTDYNEVKLILSKQAAYNNRKK